MPVFTPAPYHVLKSYSASNHETQQGNQSSATRLAIELKALTQSIDY
jgi:hypothetical protein